MMRACVVVLLGVMLTLTARAELLLDHGRFKQVSVMQPSGAVERVALFLSGNEGWNDQDRQLAQTLVMQGALVIGIDTPRLFAELAADGDECGFPDGDLENLSHFVQAYVHLSSYRLPFLVGEGNGAAFAFATLAQAPEGTFSGLLTLDFCPELKTPQPVCSGNALQSKRNEKGDGVIIGAGSRLPAPWLALASSTRTTCSVAVPPALAALSTVAAPPIDLEPMARFGQGLASVAVSANAMRPTPEPVATELEDLPLEEVPAAATEGDQLVLFLSGDGGWAGLDQEVAAVMAAQNVPVVGWDSLRYFWTPRTPEGIAADADRILRHYLQRWHKQRVILVGYSQGANVLPFLVNRLPDSMRERISLVVLMGLESKADFEFHLSNWVASSNGLPVLPEIEHFNGVTTLCLYGEDEEDSACPEARNPGLKLLRLTGGHHFDGAYDKLARTILSSATSVSGTY